MSIIKQLFKVREDIINDVIGIKTIEYYDDIKNDGNKEQCNFSTIIKYLNNGMKGM